MLHGKHFDAQTGTDKRWLLISTRPQTDLRVWKDLARHRVEAFVSLIYRRQKVGSHAWPVPERWLTPYVFVQVEDDSQFRTIHNTNGFEEFVTLSPEGPAIIGEEIIWHLKTQMAESFDEADSRSRPHEPLYRIGQRMSVIEGPFAGKRGHIDKVLGKTYRIDAGGPFPIIAKEREVMEA